MYNWYLLSKLQVKLFFYNKKRIGMILVLMISCTLVLNAKMVAEIRDTQDNQALAIVVWDRDHSVLSHKLLEAINDNANYHIERLQLPEIGESALDFFLQEDQIYGSRAYLYIEEGFEKGYIHNTQEEYIHLYKNGRDEREVYLEQLLHDILSDTASIKEMSQSNQKAFEAQLINEKSEIKEECVYVEGDRMHLIAPVGYSFSYSIFICAVSYVLIYMASWVIDELEYEKKIKVDARIFLSRVAQKEFIGSKIVGCGLIVLQGIAGLAIGLCLLVKKPIELTYFQLCIAILGYSIVIILFCILVQLIVKSTGKMQCILYVVINIGNLISGTCCYIDTGPIWIRNVALIFPQKWLIWLREEIYGGRKNVLALFMGIMLFYMLCFIFLIWGYLQIEKNRTVKEVTLYANK